LLCAREKLLGDILMRARNKFRFSLDSVGNVLGFGGLYVGAVTSVVLDRWI
jgi:hypothetical protein